MPDIQVSVVVGDAGPLIPQMIIFCLADDKSAPGGLGLKLREQHDVHMHKQITTIREAQQAQGK